MKKAVWIFVILVLVVLAAGNALLLMPPTGYFKRMLIEQTKRSTGLDLAINGHFSLRFLPNLNLRAEDTVLTSPGAAGDAQLLVARAIEIQSGLWPLVRGNRMIDRVHLVEPKLVASIDKDGRPNWQPAMQGQTRAGGGGAESRSNAPGAGGAPAVAGSTGTAGSSNAAFGVSALSFTGGTIAFSDARNDLAVQIEGADATVVAITPLGAGRAAIKSARVRLARNGTATTADLTNADATATGIRLDGRIAEAMLSASGADIKDETSRITVAISDATARLSDITATGIASATLKGGRIAVVDAGARLDATLENADATLTGLTTGRMEHADISSNKASIRDGGSGASAELSRAALQAHGLSSDSLARLLVKAARLEITTGPAGPRIMLDRATGQLASLTPDGADAISIKGDHATVHDGVGVLRMWADTPALAAPKASISRQEMQDVVLTAGAVSLGEPTRSTSPAFTTLTARLPVAGLGKPLQPVLQFGWKGQQVKGRASLPAPEAIALGAGLPAELMLDSDLAKLDFVGTIGADAPTQRSAALPPPLVKGRVKGSMTSLQAVSKWLGFALAEGADGVARLEGEIEARQHSIALSSARIEHDGQTVNADVVLDIAGSRPKLTGRITADRLDADRYLGIALQAPDRATTRSANRAPPPSEAEIQAAVRKALRDDLAAYLRALRDQPATRGRFNVDVAVPPPAATRAGARAQTRFQWDETPLPLDTLHAVDLDLDLAVEKLTVRGLEVKVARLQTRLDNGVIALVGSDISTSTGTLGGTVTLDARQPLPAVTARLKATGLDAFAVMRAIGVNPMLAGAGVVEVDLTSRGRSQRQMVETMSGTVSARIDRGGSIVGYDLTSFWSLLGLATDTSYNASKRTPFDTLTARMTLDKGVTRDSRMDLSGRAIEADGDGTIRLAAQEINYRARVKLQAYFRRLAVKLFGDWSNLTFGLDHGAFASKPDDYANLSEVFGDVFGDRTIAGLAGDVLKRAGPRGLEPEFAKFLTGLKEKGANGKP